MKTVEILRVIRNSFTGSDGKEVNYCKFYTRSSGVDTEDSCGYEIEVYNTKYDNYEVIKDLFKTGKPVQLKLDFVKQTNGLYRGRVSKLNDITL